MSPQIMVHEKWSNLIGVSATIKSRKMATELTKWQCQEKASNSVRKIAQKAIETAKPTSIENVYKTQDSWWNHRRQPPEGATRAGSNFFADSPPTPKFTSELVGVDFSLSSPNSKYTMKVGISLFGEERRTKVLPKFGGAIDLL